MKSTNQNAFIRIPKSLLISLKILVTKTVFVIISNSFSLILNFLVLYDSIILLVIKCSFSAPKTAVKGYSAASKPVNAE